MPITYIPYDPATDPMQYLNQALKQYQFTKGFSPTSSPMEMMQKTLQAGFSPQESMRLAVQQSQAKYYGQRRQQQQLTKTQELVAEGYTSEEARMIRDISHGLKPRASARKQYENMSDVEKLNFLSTLKQRAEGQYYGIDPELGGLKKPRQPKLLKWVDEELAKLEILQGTPGRAAKQLPLAPLRDSQLQGMVTPEMRGELGVEPLDLEEFLKTVQTIEDKTKAKTYYDKWIYKWR